MTKGCKDNKISFVERRYYAPAKKVLHRKEKHHFAEDRERTPLRPDSPFFRLHPEPYETKLMRVTQKLSQEKADIILADPSVIDHITEWASTVWGQDAHLVLHRLDSKSETLKRKDQLFFLLAVSLHGEKEKKKTFIVGQDQDSDTTTEPLATALREVFPEELEVFSLYVNPSEPVKTT